MPEATRRARDQSLNHTQLNDLNLLNSINTPIATWQALRLANGHGMFQSHSRSISSTNHTFHRCSLVELRRLRPCDLQHRLPDDYPLSSDDASSPTH